MIINIYKLYLLKKFTKKIFLITSIFLILVLIINLIEESNFLKNTDSDFLLPVLLSFLNSPSLIFEMFPFIFLIATQFFFIDLIDSKEFYTFKHFGLDNIKIIKFLSIISFLFGILTVILFYNFSSILKNQYLQIKNKYTNDNKYLAVITENGLWIRDIIESKIIIVNADKINGNLLLDSSITELNLNFEIEKNFIAEKIDITNNEWILHIGSVSNKDNSSVSFEKTTFSSNFNIQKINSLFSDLASLSFFKLLKLKEDYASIGYSTDEIDIQSHKLYSLPFLLLIMTVISTLLMMNIKYQKNKLFNLFIGIFLSVLIYYISHFSNLLGLNNKIPLIFSVWLPILILALISILGIIRVNEK